jgi:hypothetical protein
MNKKIIEDIEFGLSKEKTYFEEIKDKLDRTLKQSDNRYSLFDFFGDNSYVELKSRKVKHNQYPDTMVGYNKIEFAEKSPSNKVYFVFSFTDGLYYYQFNKEHIGNGIRIDYGGRTDRGEMKSRHMLI